MRRRSRRSGAQPGPTSESAPAPGVYNSTLAGSLGGRIRPVLDIILAMPSSEDIRAQEAHARPGPILPQLLGAAHVHA